MLLVSGNALAGVIGQKLLNDKIFMQQKKKCSRLGEKWIKIKG